MPEQFDLSRTRFVPGQPIGISKAQFTPEMQESIIRHYFDKSVPGAYETMSGKIQEFEANADPGSVTISREEYEALKQRGAQPPETGKIDQAKVSEQIDHFFPSEQPDDLIFRPQTEAAQQQNAPSVPQQQQGVPNEQQSNLLDRIFGSPETPVQPQEQQQSSNQQQNVNQPDIAAAVKETLTRICMERGFEPEEFVGFMQRVSIEDMADMFVAWKNASSNAMQQTGQVAVDNQNQQSQQTQPINLMEVQPNPRDYSKNEGEFQQKIASYWK